MRKRKMWGLSPWEKWEVYDGSSIASCCGSRYYSDLIPDTVVHTSQGISLYNGQYCEELETEEDLVKHIKTSNGVLTVAIRKKW